MNQYLDELERRIDSKVEEKLLALAGTCSMDGMYVINLSQPHLNDMEVIYGNTVDQGIKLLGFNREHAEKALAAGRSLHGAVHCW